MSGLLETALGPDVPTMGIVGVAVVVLGLIIALYLLLRRRGGGLAGRMRNRASRLGVLESAVVDHKRRLVLIRRDNVEHLILIGGPADVVVETNIGRPRQRPAQQQRTGVPADEAEVATRVAERTAQIAAQSQKSAQPHADRQPPREPIVAPASMEDDAIANNLLAEIASGGEVKVDAPDATKSAASAGRQDPRPSAIVADTAPAPIASEPAKNARDEKSDEAEAPSTAIPPARQEPVHQAIQQSVSPSPQIAEPQATRPDPVPANISAAGLAAGAAALAAAMNLGRRNGDLRVPATAPANPDLKAAASLSEPPMDDAPVEHADPAAESGSTDRPEPPKPIQEPQARPDTQRARVAETDVAGEFRKAFGLRGSSGGEHAPKPPASPLADRLTDELSFSEHGNLIGSDKQHAADSHVARSPQPTAVWPQDESALPAAATVHTASFPDLGPSLSADEDSAESEALRREMLRQQRNGQVGGIAGPGSMTTLGDLAARLEEALARQSAAPPPRTAPAQTTPQASHQAPAAGFANGAAQNGASPSHGAHEPAQVEVSLADDRREHDEAYANAANDRRSHPASNPHAGLQDAISSAAGGPSVIDFAGRRKAGKETLEDEMARLLGELTGDSAR